MRLKSLLMSALLLIGVFVLWRMRLKQWKAVKQRGRASAIALRLDAKQRPLAVTLMYRHPDLGKGSLLESFSLHSSRPRGLWKNKTLPHSFLEQHPQHLVFNDTTLFFLSALNGRYQVEAFSRTEGRRLWKLALPASTEPAVFAPLVPVRSGLAVLVREQGSLMKLRHRVLAVEGQTGKIRWKHSLWLPSFRRPWVVRGQLLFPGSRQMQVLEWTTGTASKWKVVATPFFCGREWVHFSPLASRSSFWRWSRLWQVDPTRLPKATSRPTTRSVLAWSGKEFSPYAPLGCAKGWFWFPELSSKGTTLRWTQLGTRKTERLVFQEGFRLMVHTLRWNSPEYALRQPHLRFQPLWLRDARSQRQRLVLLDRSTRRIHWRSRPQPLLSKRLWNDQWRLHKGHFFGLMPYGRSGQKALVVISGKTGALVSAWQWQENAAKGAFSYSFDEKSWKRSTLQGSYWAGIWKERSWVVNWKTGKVLWKRGFRIQQWKLVSMKATLQKVWGTLPH